MTEFDPYKVCACLDILIKASGSADFPLIKAQAWKELQELDAALRAPSPAPAPAPDPTPTSDRRV